MALLILLHETEIWTHKEGQKTIDISRDEIFQKNSRVRPLLTT